MPPSPAPESQHPPRASAGPDRAIVVMGVSGCGKSTLGALLAATLGCRFLEGDAFHSADAVEKMRAGTPLDDADRWPWLARVGGAGAQAMAQDGTVVLACSALRRAYRDALRERLGGRARFVLLEHDRDRLLARLESRPGHYMPSSLLDSQLATLERPGPGEDALVLASLDPPEALCGAVIEWLGDTG